MRPKLFITDEAEREIQDAYDWYEEQASGLGERLLYVIDDTLDLIIDFPDIAPVRRKDYHEQLLSGFPYMIIYRFTEDQIIVHQLFHIKRRPGKKIK